MFFISFITSFQGTPSNDPFVTAAPSHT